MSPRLDGPGTGEDDWAASGVLDALPVVDAAACRPPGLVVVVAPHPDDEVLGAGAALAGWAAAGTPVLVVAVTDGEGSHPGSPTLTPAALVEARAGERRSALTELGLDPDAVHRIGLPDGGVTAGPVADALHGLLAPGDVCLAPVPGDGHPDHDAAADGASRAAAAVGAARWSYAIWLWHWARPDEQAGTFAGARRVRADDRSRAAKARAVRCFTTQIAPLSDDPRDAAVLPPRVLARFARTDEVLWGPA